MTTPAYVDNITSFASNQFQEVFDNVLQLDLTVAYSSIDEPTARTIMLWDDPGTGGPYPLTNNRGATLTTDIRVDVNNNISDINSLSLVENNVNPNSASTLWVKASDKNLYFGNNVLSPIGSVISFAGSVAPTGWLLCNASSVLRSSYQALFNVIGTTFGSVSGTTFNLPDLRSRFICGTGWGVYKHNGIAHATGGLLREMVLAESRGAEYCSGGPCTTGMPNTDEASGSILSSTGGNVCYIDDTEAPNSFLRGNASISNLPPYCALNYIIKF